jgi:hypothetical protein
MLAKPREVAYSCHMRDRDDDIPRKVLTPAAQRALDEAQARREAAAKIDQEAENGGPSGLEPTRYGDWERKGIAVDF